MVDFYRSRRPSNSKMWLNLGLLAGAVAATGVTVPLVLSNMRNDPPAANAAAAKPAGDPAAPAPAQQPNAGESKRDTDKRAPQSPAAPQPPAVANEVPLPAYEVFDSYATNEPAAKAKYNDRTVKVMATVGRVWDAEGQGVWVVEVVEHVFVAKLDLMQCKFARDPKSGVLELKPGAHVTIQGVCRGFTKGELMLESCTLLPTPSAKGGEAVLKVSAKEVWRAYLKDSTAARAKYRGRVIETDGDLFGFAAIPLLNTANAYLIDELENPEVTAAPLKIPCYFVRQPPADVLPKREVVPAKLRARVNDNGFLPHFQECELLK